LPSRSWLRSLSAPAGATHDLVCFPFSGGSAQAFLTWAGRLPPQVSLWGVQYPGRGDRFGEPFCRGVQEAGLAIATNLVERGLDRAALVGHSLGAVIAYETAVQLTRMKHGPRSLVVSSCAPPGVMRHRSLPAASEDDLWTGLEQLGGIDSEILRNAELREVLSPILRSDLALHGDYSPSAGGPFLACPIMCYQASSDPIVDDDVIERWATFTTATFRSRRVEGDHFHAFEESSPVVTDVTDELLAVPNDRRQ
jgi:pyochelin biosynthetic protein PchC